MSLGCTLIIRDVTHHKTLEKQLLRSERLAAAGKLAAGIAHEINNPIGIVLNRLDCLSLDASEGSPESDLQADLGVIRAQTERVGEVARRLLSLSRDEPDVREPLDLNELVGRVIHFLEPGLAKKSLRVDWDLASDLPLLQASHNGIETVILNLLLNAVDASPEGGEISVITHAVEDGRAVKLQVSDAGPGIEEELLERIFEPFFTTKEGPRGTGLGLAVTRSVAQSHGGDVTVQSEPGVGSCFTVTLPLQPGKGKWKRAVS
jgi:signal transduction histidine kinase